jgi:steroid delta-isomerase-like uncharacterized protein
MIEDMRPPRFVASVVALIALTACRRELSVVPSPVQLLFERALTLRDTSALTRAVADSLIFHARGQSATVSRSQLWHMAEPILSAFPDARFHVDDEVRSGEKVAARITLSGTHRGTWNGVAATGRSIRVTEMFICQLKLQRLSECWQEWDEYGLRQQLGLP